MDNIANESNQVGLFITNNVVFLGKSQVRLQENWFDWD